jgi:N-carbamoyl-L-amino-acid hydrolase
MTTESAGRRSVPVDGAAFLASMRELSLIGATAGGGVHRLAASAEDGQARDWLAQWLRQRGFTIKVDAIGNLFGVLEWRRGAPYVLCGSHLDSQPQAGKLDGAYGVVAAAHAADRLRLQAEANGEVPAFNVAVVSWTNEEGARFQPSLLGSSVYSKTMTAADALAVCDEAGISVGEALTAIGYAGRDQAPWPPAVCAEIHIEQGHALEDAGRSIGLVAFNWAAHKYEIEVIGRQAHTGPTPMAERRDALLGASYLIVAARELVEQLAPRLLHTSVARLVTRPNSPNSVTSQATLFLELRSPDPEVLVDAERLLFEAFERVRQNTGVAISCPKVVRRGVRHFDAEGLELARASAHALGLECMELATVAGQDAIAVGTIVPSVMLFVPSFLGIGHHEEEHTDDALLVSGVDMLTEVLARLCAGDLRSTVRGDLTARVAR